MKQLIALFAFLLIGTAGLTAQDAPTAREIGDTYIENTGGKDAWLAIKAMKIKGKASMQGMEFPMEIVSAEGDKQHLKVDVQGQTIIQAYDGKTAWQVMPFMGITEPTPMSDDESEQMRSTKFLSEFINSEERGFKLELVEGKEVEGTATYGVHVTNDDGHDITYYFDQEYMVPIMTMMTVKSGPQKGVVVETYLSDYQEVESVMIPMFMDVKYNGTTIQKINVNEVVLNPEVKDEMFMLPKK
ncbi:hypothetical protein QWY85_17935 [Neolewinella lacunae]|uniref:Outer membrane lipoprotein-sorting protein n=1 Tax=Neolewinella lacunae TaxID=1517758 RepID=A0A923T9P6_9BACT|nr:hypothetical protein [Neolewinella lacunae]MBC6995754.1 hypothetical protein [Neolewinella lacunae]MDN3636553.1 hypothetical protein [Neolewinella lacunae]